MLVFDVTERQSFEALKFWQSEVEKYANENVVQVVVGNKSDQTEKRQVSFDEAYQYCKIVYYSASKRGFQYF